MYFYGKEVGFMFTFVGELVADEIFYLLIWKKVGFCSYSIDSRYLAFCRRTSVSVVDTIIELQIHHVAVLSYSTIAS